VTGATEKADNPFIDRLPGQSTDRWLPWVLAVAVVFVLLYQLGGAALFEPDEGRNSEKAREILVLNDWVTPHENFHPVLDKPMFFYWLIALSFKIFGVHEWAARLPSALAALGCVLLVYCFARARWGRWEAMWSALLLLTSTQFFILARVVIFDMTLTFLQTVALWAFYEAAHSDNAHRRRNLCMIMYLALGGGTLIKGLIGVVIPGMIVFFYILLLRRWQILRKLYPIPGALLFLAVVSPWYLQADARNAGYLSYYIWTEHFGRYTSANFDRSEPWYYFIFVALIGFFPWTPLLPFVAKEYWKKKLDDKTVFLIVWAALPFIFFSASKSKLPHYILPIFPALSILAATTLVRMVHQSGARLRSVLSTMWSLQALNALYLGAGSLYPGILPSQIRDGVGNMAQWVWFFAAFSIFMLGYTVMWKPPHGVTSHRRLYLVQGFAAVVFVAFLAQMMISISPERSSRVIAETARSHITPTTQLVFYDTYLESMAFYLRAERPVWVITSGKKKRTFLGNYYALGKRADPLTPWGKALFNFDEFRRQWKSTDRPLLVVVKEKNLPRLAENVGEKLERLAAINEYILVSKR
jgi:4-amino-4-deoxy-L-arabinose transferase-like glycosyltransferase